MRPSSLIAPFLLAFLASPASAQCGPGHSGHSGNSGHQGHPSQEPAPKKVTATNTLCPVMGREVKPGRDREVVVRGKTYLVCCDGCGPAMAENYDKYLDADGRPRNAPKDPGPAKKDSKEKEARPAPPAPPAEGHKH